jgi:putative ABC transport system permease protein
VTSLSFVIRMAAREARGSWKRLAVPAAAVAVGVAALVSIDAFTAGVLAAVRSQARELLGADVAVSTAQPFSPAAEALLARVAAVAGPEGTARVTNLGAMAYVPGKPGSRLVQLAAIEPGYPFYGTVVSSPPEAWANLTRGDGATVESALLPALDAQVGDVLVIGEARFAITGTIDRFPGDVAIRAALGPRVFIPERRLAETGLILPGSRVRYEAFFRIPPGNDAQVLADSIRKPLANERVNLRTVADDQDRLSQTLARLGRYLGLVALLALLLGGIGVATAMHVFVKRRTESVAVLRCLGADTRLVLLVYLAQALLVGLAGSAVGAAAGLGASRLLPRVAGDFLPMDLSLVLPSPWSALGGAAFGVLGALAFALLPILALRRIPPLLALRRAVDESAPSRRDPAVLAAFAVLALFVVGLAVIEARGLRVGLGFAGGIAVALAVLYGVSWTVTRALRRFTPARLPYLWRQGLANLHRPANQTATVVLALGFGAFLLATLVLVQHNLLRELRTPGGARPNLVFFDVQPDQKDALHALLRDRGGSVVSEVPIVPMRIQAINGRAVKESLGEGSAEDIRGRWALRREYRSSYRDALTSSEQVVKGTFWSRGQEPVGDVVEVSLERGVARELEVGLGDTIDWDVQGVVVKSRVTSLREVSWTRFEPNFFAVFPASALEGAPQTLATLVRLEDAAARARLARSVAETLPNVSSLDATAVQEALDGVVAKAAAAVRFMALFTLGAGAAVLLGAVAASRYQRVREGALLRTLGATRRQVVRILVAEYASLGLVSVGVALGLSLLAGLALTRFVFEARFAIPWTGLAILAASVTAMTVVIGLLASGPAFRGTPVEVLRAE